MSATGREYRRHRVARRARSYARSPKGRLLLFFCGLAVLGAAREDIGRVFVAIVAGVGTAAAVDVALRLLIRREWVAPSGAVLTGFGVTLVLNPYAPWFVPVAAAAVGVAAKHLVRTRTANVFNPSALGLVLGAIVLGRGLSWWGSLPAYGPLGALAIIVIGALTADHVNKLPLVLVFLGTFFSLFAATTFAPGGSIEAEVFFAPDAHAALFFAFFMLDDPPTSPARYVDQLWYGMLVAVLALIVFAFAAVAYYLPMALLIGNVAEAGRRLLRDRRRLVGEGAGPLARGLAE